MDIYGDFVVIHDDKSYGKKRGDQGDKQIF